MADFTYEEAVEIRAKWLELRKQLPKIISEAKGSKPMTQIARDLQYNRTQLYNIVGE